MKLTLAISSALHLALLVNSPASANTLVEPRQHDSRMDMTGMDGLEGHDLSALPSFPALTHSKPSVKPMPPSHHSHGSHVAAKTKLDDDEVHLWHSFPPSYLSADFRLDNNTAIFGEEFDALWDPQEAQGHRKLMILHVAMMVVAYFGALPVAMALRAANHHWHYIANGAFLAIAGPGWLAGAAYKAMSVNRYEGSSHGTFGHVLLIISALLAVVDVVGYVTRAYRLEKSPKSFWTALTASHHEGERLIYNPYEMVGMAVDHRGGESVYPLHGHGGIEFVLGEDDEDSIDHGLPGSSSRPSSFSSRLSTGSDDTLHDSANVVRKGRWMVSDSSTEDSTQAEHPDSAGGAHSLWTILTWIRRLQVVVAYVVVLTGLTVYTGMCRGSFLAACAAHFIKGSIFFGYGCFTFARYLGAYADMGWAWNSRPDGRTGPSAEMIECAVIFTYGITNTWMERIGAQAGDPYTVKQVQHISIAVMFWFAGLSGMLLESRTMRRILSTIAGRNSEQPVSGGWRQSFNPLPALVIAVTGLAMAAHHQDYVFQVEIHTLWGLLLAGGSAFRLLTYFFLYVRQQAESQYPSRPPTEILAAFGWAAGGIVFMFSDEEVAFAAMRAGYDDMMAFLNITIALTSLVFCWTLCVLAIKGYAILRLQGNVKTEVEV